MGLVQGGDERLNEMRISLITGIFQWNETPESLDGNYESLSRLFLFVL